MSTGTEPVTAGFSMQADAVRYLAEAEFGDELAAARALAAAVAAPFGQLILAGAGQPPIGLYDDLLPLADGLGPVVADLRSGKATALGAYSQPDVLRFAPEGDDVLVTDRHSAQRRYPAAALVAALAACHGRLIALLHRLEPTDPRWGEKLARLAA